MIRREIINKKTGEKLIMFEDSDFEYEKPVKHFGDGFIVKQMVLRGIRNEELNGDKKPTEKRDKYLLMLQFIGKKCFKSLKQSKSQMDL